MMGEGGAQRRDAPRQRSIRRAMSRRRDLGARVHGQGGQHGRRALADDGVDHRRSDGGTTRHLYLVLDRRLMQQPDQVVVYRGRGWRR